MSVPMFPRMRARMFGSWPRPKRTHPPPYPTQDTIVCKADNQCRQDMGQHGQDAMSPRLALGRPGLSLAKVEAARRRLRRKGHHGKGIVTGCRNGCRHSGEQGEPCVGKKVGEGEEHVEAETTTTKCVGSRGRDEFIARHSAETSIFSKKTWSTLNLVSATRPY